MQAPLDMRQLDAVSQFLDGGRGTGTTACLIADRSVRESMSKSQDLPEVQTEVPIALDYLTAPLFPARAPALMFPRGC